MKINKYKVDTKDEEKFESLVKSISEKLESSELISEFKELIRLIKHNYHKGFVDFFSQQTNGARSAIKYLFDEDWERIIDFGDCLEIRKSSSQWMRLDSFNNVFFINENEIVHAEKDSDMFLFYQAFRNASLETYIQIRESTVFEKEDFDRVTIIKICFESLMNHLKSDIQKKESLKKISHYKLTVITGLILKEIKIDGVKIINDSISDSSITFKEIHNSLVPHTKRFKKKCELWLK